MTTEQTHRPVYIDWQHEIRIIQEHEYQDWATDYTVYDGNDEYLEHLESNTAYIKQLEADGYICAFKTFYKQWWIKPSRSQ